MHRQEVSSTSLRSVGYDIATQTLEIAFQSGGIYRYFDVPANVYIELMGAASHGQYFRARIRDVYRWQKVA